MNESTKESTKWSEFVEWVAKIEEDSSDANTVCWEATRLRAAAKVVNTRGEATAAIIGASDFLPNDVDDLIKHWLNYHNSNPIDSQKIQMYIIKQTGGEYDERWEKDLFCTPSNEIAELLLERLRRTKDAYEDEWDRYSKTLTSFLEEWEKQNPKPEKINLDRPRKPIQPPYPASLKGLSRIEKRDRPEKQEYRRALDKFNDDLSAWYKLDYELRAQELAPYDAWLEAKNKAEEEFKKNNFRNVSYIPKEWQEELDDILGKDYFASRPGRTDCSFLMEEIPVLTPKS